MKKSIMALALLVTFATVARAELLTGQVMLHGKGPEVLGLKTSAGLVAVVYGPAMKFSGIASLDELKPCDEVAVDVVWSGPSRVINAVTLKKKGNSETCPPVTAQDVPLAEFYRALGDRSAMVIDVRSVGEYSKAHFAGDVNIPLGEIEGRIAEIPRDKPVILYCATARRSAFASAMLLEKGVPTRIVKGNLVVKDGKPQIEQ